MTSASVRFLCSARNCLPFGGRKFQIAQAENKNEIALNRNAHAYPMPTTVAPRNVPIVRLVHCVVCVSEFAVWISCLLAMVGRMAERPAVKNGDAIINS